MVLVTGAIVGIAVGFVSAIFVASVSAAGTYVAISIKKMKPSSDLNASYQNGTSASDLTPPISTDDYSTMSDLGPTTYKSHCDTLSQRNYKVVNDRPGVDRPKLRCLIIGSPGDQPTLPGSVPKQMSAYLHGVGEDVNEIQEMLKGDPSKEISMVPQDGFTSNNLLSLSKCKKYIKKQMEDIKLASHNHSNGLLIWYSGHGKMTTGDWSMTDGFLTFKHIYDLYKKCFKARPLYIVTDCCYSGAWVVKCAELFDRDDIKCGESAGMNIKVFASCLPRQKAYDKYYMQLKGTRLHTNEEMRRCKTICFAEHRRLHTQGCSNEQYTLGVDFTRYRECIKDERGECIHLLTWTEYVQYLIGQDPNNDYLI